MRLPVPNLKRIQTRIQVLDYSGFVSTALVSKLRDLMSQELLKIANVNKLSKDIKPYLIPKLNKNELDNLDIQTKAQYKPSQQKYVP